MNLPNSRAVLTPSAELRVRDGMTRRVRVSAELAALTTGEHPALHFELYGEHLAANGQRPRDYQLVLKARGPF